MKRAFTILVILVASLFVGFFVYDYVAHSGKARLEIVVAPSDATIVIDGERYETGEYYIDIGKHNAVVSRLGFAEATRAFEVFEDNNPPLAVGLVPVTEEAWNLVRNDSAYDYFEQASSEAAAFEGARFVEKNPIIENLPYNGVGFSINYRLVEDTEDEIVVVVDHVDEFGKSTADDLIKYWGYSLDEIRVEYKLNPYSPE